MTCIGRASDKCSILTPSQVRRHWDSSSSTRYRETTTTTASPCGTNWTSIATPVQTVDSGRRTVDQRVHRKPPVRRVLPHSKCIAASKLIMKLVKLGCNNVYYMPEGIQSFKNVYPFVVSFFGSVGSNETRMRRTSSMLCLPVSIRRSPEARYRGARSRAKSARPRHFPAPRPGRPNPQRSSGVPTSASSHTTRARVFFSNAAPRRTYASPGGNTCASSVPRSRQSHSRCNWRCSWAKAGESRVHVVVEVLSPHPVRKRGFPVPGIPTSTTGGHVQQAIGGKEQCIGRHVGAQQAFKGSAVATTTSSSSAAK